MWYKPEPCRRLLFVPRTVLSGSWSALVGAAPQFFGTGPQQTEIPAWPNAGASSVVLWLHPGVYGGMLSRLLKEVNNV